jgi:hypothetical protein
MPRDRSSGPRRAKAPGGKAVKPVNLSPWFFARIVVLGCAAVGASGWAVARFYTRVHRPMVVPAPTMGESTPRDAGTEPTELIPAPEIEVQGR